MMLRIAGNTDGEHLLERAVLRDVLRIEVRTVHGIVGHGLHTGVDDSRIGQFNLLVNVGFVFDDKHEIADDSSVFRVTSLAGTAFRRAFQRLVNLFDIASLRIEMNATIIELLGNPQVSLDFLLRHISKLLLLPLMFRDVLVRSQPEERAQAQAVSLRNRRQTLLIAFRHGDEGSSAGVIFDIAHCDSLRLLHFVFLRGSASNPSSIAAISCFFLAIYSSF